MTDSLSFVLPDGRRAEVSRRAAHQICERLWALGISPGAATAAVRIADALRTRLWLGTDVAFTQREIAPLIEASNHNPLTWGRSASRHAIPVEHRQPLLAKCDELIDAINDDPQHQHKLQTLVHDLERLRDSLRASESG